MNASQKWCQPIDVHFAVAVEEDEDLTRRVVGAEHSGSDKARPLWGSD